MRPSNSGPPPRRAAQQLASRWPSDDLLALPPVNGSRQESRLCSTMMRRSSARCSSMTLGQPERSNQRLAEETPTDLAARGHPLHVRPNAPWSLPSSGNMRPSFLTVLSYFICSPCLDSGSPTSTCHSSLLSRLRYTPLPGTASTNAWLPFFPSPGPDSTSKES